MGHGPHPPITEAPSQFDFHPGRKDLQTTRPSESGFKSRVAIRQKSPPPAPQEVIIQCVEEVLSMTRSRP